MEINVNDKNAKKVLITETILRDAHQSQAATRMRLDEMIPALDALDNVGYYSLEAWGGATFDSCLRFLNEDPWERLRVLKSHLKKTPIQMLLRGQNLLGYRHYADDLVEKFVEKSIENGVTVLEAELETETEKGEGETEFSVKRIVDGVAAKFKIEENSSRKNVFYITREVDKVKTRITVEKTADGYKIIDSDGENKSK